MRKCVWTMLLAGLVLLASCGEEEYVYPPVVTDIVSLESDSLKRVTTLILDNGRQYGVINADFKSIYANATLRALTTYIPTDSTHATIYNATTVPILQDSTAVLRHDPLTALSAWQSGDFINMHLQPKTQGMASHHYWGYGVDSRSSRHLCLSLHHAQNDDPVSYSAEMYVSIDLNQFGNKLESGDTVSLSIETFKGPKTWQFIYK